MYKGIYIAVSSAILKQSEMDIISQNLANVNTTGYKKDRMSFREHLISQINRLNEPFDGRTMSDISMVITDFSNGVLRKTGNPLNVGIEGNGFFTLEGNRYTRRGDFVLDGEGYLTTHNGIKVLGSGGPILIPEGNIEINDAGDITVNGELIDTLKITDFNDLTVLKKTGEGIFMTDEQGKEAEAFLKQGYVESSNVDAISEMVQMITTLREFQTLEKAIHSFDDAMSKVINEMGRI